MYFIDHLDLMPVFYGLIMAWGILSVIKKFDRGQWTPLLIEVAVFFIVFKLHGGTLKGGFAAMICSLIIGLIVTPKRRRL